MEFLGAWKSIEVLQREARNAEIEKKELAEKSKPYRKAYDESLDKESLTPLIDYMKSYNPTDYPLLNDLLQMLQNMDFQDGIDMLKPYESYLKPSNSAASNEYKFAWCGEPV